MKQSLYGLLIWIALILPPAAHLLESVMIVHMHMQMPLLAFTGFLMAKYFQIRFPLFFEKWNSNGIPGILLFIMISVYWMIPRTMDEALTIPAVEWFKFISLPLMAGIPLRDSWKKIGSGLKTSLFIGFAVLFLGMGLLYIYSPEQLCNNYLRIDQITLGWGFILMAVCLAIYVLYDMMMDHSAYE